MNYIGSKLKLISFIKETIYSVVGADLNDKIFCDLFAGTGIVGRSLKQEVDYVIANDFEFYSYVLNKNYIYNNNPVAMNLELIEKLNNLQPTKGFIYNNYCSGSGSERQYFSDQNGQKIDAIRLQIDRWRNEKIIDSETFYFLLTSLLESADKIANTASVYGAFLKQIKKTAAKDLIIVPANFELNGGKNQVYNCDSNKLIQEISGDILYLDPPYNARQYGANYHMLNTIALYDNFIPKGKTGLRDYQRSDYCSKRSVSEAFKNLISEAKFRYIFLSYNNEGLMNEAEVKKIMSKFGHYDLVQKSYQRFKADKDANRNHSAKDTKEYIHILEKFQETK